MSSDIGSDVTCSKVSHLTEADAVDIDEALELTGHRWFHWKLVLIGGLAFLGIGFEFTLQGYIQPLAQCDLDLDAAKMSIITSGFIACSVASSLFWGVLADAVGRKRILVFGIIVEGLCTVAATFANSSEAFTVIRCAGGLLLGAGITVILTYVGEFCSDKKRPRNICFLGMAWTSTWLIMPGMAAAIIPLNWELDLEFVTYKPWRLFIALVGGINLLAGTLIALFLPETPKYYLSRGMEYDSLIILRQMYVENTGNPHENYPVKKLAAGKFRTNIDGFGTGGKKESGTFWSLFLAMLSQMQILFRPPLLWSVFLGSSVYICSMFGYYSLGLWLPELFLNLQNFYENHPNETTEVCQLSMDDNSTIRDVLDCTGSEALFTIFTNTFYLGAACIGGVILTTYLADKVPVKLIVATVMELAAICVLGLYFATAPWLIILFAAGFLSCANIAISTHHACAVNLFPTSVRGMGVCISLLFGRSASALANLLFGQLIDQYCDVPVLLVAAFAMAGGVFSFIIPKSSQKALE